mgnify:CR=1 FL=1
MNLGFMQAIGAFFIWGLFPLYWKLLQSVPATQIVAHRIAWSFVILFIVILLTKRSKELMVGVRNKTTVGIYALAAVLVSINWVVYVWAVNAGFVVETSLGYFINPLVSVLLGVVFLKERLRKLQWVAVGSAFCGVLYLALVYGQVPWIALTLGISFGFYGLVKKKAPLGAISGLTVETGVLFLPALGFLLYSEWQGVGSFAHSGPLDIGLLIGAGLITTVPLLLFASATKNVPLSLVGIFQYIAPTMHLMFGLFVFKETFTFHQFVGYGFVWLAVLLFIVDGIRRYRANQKASGSSKGSLNNLKSQTAISDEESMLSAINERN